MTHSLVLHACWRPETFSGTLSGIHGAHLGHIEYIATDTTNQTIPWVAKIRTTTAQMTEFVSSDAKAPVQGQKHLMDCIDCHNRAAHSFDTPEDSAQQSDGRREARTPSLPFVHKEGLALIKADYTSQDDAESKITAGLEDFYRSQHPEAWSQQRAQIDEAAKALVAIYGENVFPVDEAHVGNASQ